MVTHFAVDAVASGPAWHGHLVLLATGITALPAEPGRAGAVACVGVTAAPWALAAPAAQLGQPPVASSTLAALGAGSPWSALALPTLGVALGALGSWSAGTGATAPTAVKAEVSLLTAVTALSRHSCLAQTLPAMGVAGLCPARGAVAPRAVAGQQGAAVEAGGAGLAAGPRGVVQAAAAGAGQGVAVAEQHVGVAVATAVAGLAGAAQHQRVPEEAGRTPLAGGPRVTGLAEALAAAPSQDAARGKVVGRHRQGAGAADAGGCGVAGPTAHEASLAAFTVVSLRVVLAVHTDAGAGEAAV